ncbi:nitroreductase family protein [Methanobrevibacter sp. UBA188]|uniref:nitroreductase family protein n=1 Tax=Methanobrevibacter sp. UBA188 TaxID=1915473 RepID=UPI0025DB5899|nr:nitroreductase family protein [Methanobrevibacter sp. UBA188]
MDLKEAMQKRHMVRKYIDKSLPDDLINRINERISMNNEKHKLSMKLMINNNKGVNSIMKLIMAKGVNNFIILAGDNSENLDERLGYSGADIMLYAQTLGLNTWWVGGTFNRSVSQYVENKKVTGIIAIGYGESQGKPHKSKMVEDVSKYNGTVIPSWFISGVDGALLAPTALNKQDFMIIGDGNKVKIECDNGIFTGSNVGLIKYHFELGAGKENFEWE